MDEQAGNSHLSATAIILRDAETEAAATVARLRAETATAEQNLFRLRQALRAIGVEPGSVIPRRHEPRRPTIQKIAIDALGSHFPCGGTTADILACAHDVYGHVGLTRESLAPQLSRLKARGRVQKNGRTWLLTSSLAEGEPQESRETDWGRPVGKEVW